MTEPRTDEEDVPTTEDMAAMRDATLARHIQIANALHAGNVPCTPMTGTVLYVLGLQILMGAGMPQEEIDQLAKAARLVYSLRGATQGDA